jgi:DNA invertase Pin-like site-specific DNA recombinase
MKKVIGIARVSTQKQMQKGNSVEDQAEQITGFAKENEMELIEIRKIQASGKKQLLNVGELSEVIKQAKQLAAEIVVTKIDRISRDQITLLMLKKASDESGVEIHVASMGRKISEISDLEFSMIAVLAESERKQIAERTKHASRNRIGPMGISLDPSQMGKRSVEARAQITQRWAEAIKFRDRIANAVEQLKNPNLSNVAKWLNGENMTTIKGNTWNQVNLRQQMNRLGWSWQEIKKTPN